MAAIAGMPTPNGVTVATFIDDNCFAEADDFTATVAYGSDVVVHEFGPGAFYVTASLTLPAAGLADIPIWIADHEGSFDYVVSSIYVTAGGAGASERSDDPQNALFLPVGEAAVSANTGGLRISHPLDFDLSPGTDVGGNPALFYNSATVNGPVIEAVVGSDPDLPVPSGIEVTLYMDGVVVGSGSSASVRPSTCRATAICWPCRRRSQALPAPTTGAWK